MIEQELRWNFIRVVKFGEQCHRKFNSKGYLSFFNFNAEIYIFHYRKDTVKFESVQIDAIVRGRFGEKTIDTRRFPREIMVGESRCNRYVKSGIALSWNWVILYRLTAFEVLAKSRSTIRSIVGSV